MGYQFTDGEYYSTSSGEAHLICQRAAAYAMKTGKTVWVKTLGGMVVEVIKPVGVGE